MLITSLTLSTTQIVPLSRLRSEQIVQSSLSEIIRHTRQ